MIKYILLDSGFCWLHTIKLKSNDDIELSSDLLELVASECIKNNININFYKSDDEELKELFDEYENVDGYIYLDLSCYDIDYNIYLDIRNFKLLDEIPKTYEINLEIEV